VFVVSEIFFKYNDNLLPTVQFFEFFKSVVCGMRLLISSSDCCIIVETVLILLFNINIYIYTHISVACF
jgi:hypothetical protein